jgi:NAD(P)-dependent dehydrogenase (short-subunit alcohol dehydrogenase family)
MKTMADVMVNRPINEKVFRLDGKVAVVTGGTGGIGAAICTLYANVGANVAVVDLDAGQAQALADEINKAGGTAIGIGCDVTKEASTLEAVARVVAELGKPTVLVNGVAVLDKSGTILEIDPEEWEKVHRVNIHGYYLMSRAVLPHMIEAGGGSVIHIASMHGQVGRANRVSYTSTKGAIMQMGRTMAADHAAQGIRVNTLSPGAVQTRRITYRYNGEMPADLRKQVESKYLLGRMADPAELATGALFLASDASSFMTGSDLLIDGGYCAV